MVRRFSVGLGCLNDAIVNDEDVLTFARRWLGSDEICLRGASCSVRYPGFTDGTGRHTDGFSLLPNSGADRSHAQLKFWYYLSDVGPGMAPISFWPTDLQSSSSNVLGPEESFQAPAGSLAMFSIITNHSRSNFVQPEGDSQLNNHLWISGVRHWMPDAFDMSCQCTCPALACPDPTAELAAVANPTQ